jgi:phosphoglucosamine mutase
MNTQLFGTDGVRGVYGVGVFSPPQILCLAEAIAVWMSNRYGVHRPVFIIRDTRCSSPALSALFGEKLSSRGMRVIDGGILPTGAAWHVGRLLDASCAIIISASHNPPDDNGIKIIDCAYGKLSTADELEIESYFYKNQMPMYHDQGRSILHRTDGIDLYAAAILEKYPRNFLAGTRILVDCAEGAMSGVAPLILEKFGATVIACADSGDGSRINVGVGAVYPAYSVAQAQLHGATIGCAFDGDGDRLSLATPQGAILRGDDLLVYYAEHYRYTTTACVVGTILVNGAVEKYLAQLGKKLIRVSVGDRAVAQALSADAQYGGEPSGHYIFGDQGPLSDGLLSALNFFELCVARGSFSWEPIQRYPVATAAIPYTEKKDLTMLPIHSYIKEAEQQLAEGRLVVRYSGTEQILRIFGEGPDAAVVNTVIDSLVQHLMKELQ